MPTTITLYDVGDVARAAAAFTNVAGTATDPTTVTANVRAPDGTVTPYVVAGGQIVKDSVGNYHLDIPVTLPGDWYYQINGTGAITAAEEGTFTARAPETAGGAVSATALTTLGAAREYVLRDATDGSQDSMLRRLINAYSRAVFTYTKREWLPQTNGQARKFQFDGGGFLSLEPFELRTLTSITMYTDLPTANQRILTAGTSFIQGEFRLHPPNKTAEGTYQWITMPQAAYGVNVFGVPSYYNNAYPYGPVGRESPLDFEVTVLGDWGVGSVPADVELAVLIAIKDAYENPTGYSSGNVGGLAFTEALDAQTGPEARARNLPIEARALLSDYKRGSAIVAV